jgi:hypothetical protein
MVSPVSVKRTKATGAPGCGSTRVQVRLNNPGRFQA